MKLYSGNKKGIKAEKIKEKHINDKILNLGIH